MSDPMLAALASIAAVSAVSLVGLFFYPARIARAQGFLLVCVGLAAGALLGDAFIHLIPESTEVLGDTAALWVLGGMGALFVLEKFLHWHHHHEPHDGAREACHDCDEHIAPFGTLILVSDALHNVIDGMVIAAGYLVSFEVGLATTIAVMLHEIPQEIGDFGVLLHAGFSRARALFANAASALSAFLGAGIVFLLGGTIDALVPVLSAVAAGAFVYIATADLIPQLHHTRTSTSLAQLGAVVCGVLLMVGLSAIEAHEPEQPERHVAEAQTVLAPPRTPPTPTYPAAPAAVLLRVIDGDTIVVEIQGIEEPVRLVGIDAPEMRAGNRKTPECFAREATLFLTERLPKGTVLTLHEDATQDVRDTYGRLLAYVHDASSQINEILVREGYARVYRFKGTATESSAHLLTLEEEARRAGRGLWGECAMR